MNAPCRRNWHHKGAEGIITSGIGNPPVHKQICNMPLDRGAKHNGPHSIQIYTHEIIRTAIIEGFRDVKYFWVFRCELDNNICSFVWRPITIVSDNLFMKTSWSLYWVPIYLLCRDDPTIFSGHRYTWGRQSEPRHEQHNRTDWHRCRN